MAIIPYTHYITYYLHLLLDCIIHSNVYLLIPYPTLPLPSSLSALGTTSLISVSMSLFLFCMYIHLYYFLDSKPVVTKEEWEEGRDKLGI